jgi:membrane protease YdiL (CAAX protease family)
MSPDKPFLLPFLALLILTLLTQLGFLAYNVLTGASGPSASEQSLASVLMTASVILAVMTIPLAGLGLRLGGRVGLAAPLLTDLLTRTPGAGDRLRRDARLAVPLGLGVGVLLLLMRLALEPYLPPELPAFGFRGVMGGLLASVSAAVAEETWVRLGVMTIVAAPVARVLGHQDIRPMVAWPSIVFAALAFGLIHLPQLAQFGAATPAAIAGTMLGNGIVGVLCGWLYWRRSLVAAILAHFAVDLILHVLPALWS